jgi:hypothetical protein
MSIKRDASFDSFVSQAQGMLGSDLSEDWLFEVWQGADADVNRALNHVLDTPENKIKRGGGGKHSSHEPKTPKKSKPPRETRESKPAPATPATTWGDDDYAPPLSPLPPPAQHPAPPSQQTLPQQAYPQPGMPQMPYGYPVGSAPMQQPQQQPMQYPQYGGMPMSMPQMMPSAPQVPQFVIDPMTGLPIAPMTPAQQAQTLFVQQQQQQRLMQLKFQVDSVLSNPAALSNPQIMQNLQDTMIQALEAPNATLQMAERARQSQQTANFIQLMQNQVGQMLSDPKVATNPQLLQQLNNQMNQLRVLTMQHVAQQQIDANPATALSMSMPLLTAPTPSTTMLSRAVLQANQGLEIPQPLHSSQCDNNEDWWLEGGTPKKGGLSEKNPFKDDGEASPRRRLPVTSSVPNLNMMNQFNQIPMSMPNMFQPQQQINPLAAMYSAQQLPGMLNQGMYSAQQLNPQNGMYYGRG